MSTYLSHSFRRERDRKRGKSSEAHPTVWIQKEVGPTDTPSLPDLIRSFYMSNGDGYDDEWEGSVFGFCCCIVISPSPPLPLSLPFRSILFQELCLAHQCKKSCGITEILVRSRLPFASSTSGKASRQAPLLLLLHLHLYLVFRRRFRDSHAFVSGFGCG